MSCAIFIPGGADRYVNYRRAVENAGGRAVFSERPGTDEGCDGLEPERDAAEFLLLERFTAAGKPVLGICRGLQTINVFFGGTLAQNVPGHEAVDGEDKLHPVRMAPSSLSRICGEEAVVNSAHHQAADRLGQGLAAVQWAADGVVEALEHETLPVWGVQWHPERLPGELGRRLFAAFLERCR